MTTSYLDALSQRLGILPGYISETGEQRTIAPEAKRAIIAALGLAADTEEEARASLQALSEAPPAAAPAEHETCFLPDGLAQLPAWGVTCQIYGLRSPRNLGIGDFDDLGRLAEVTAAMGADFLGVSPLHAPFGADPARRSPYAPSSRRFLNPLFIAVDRLAEDIGVVMEEPAEAAVARRAQLIDYPAVAALKFDLLRRLFASFEERHANPAGPLRQEFGDFLVERGEVLHRFALFEALSEEMTRQGHGSGWFGWPAPYRDIEGSAVRDFGEARGNLVRFHAWLQWCADRQLGRARDRARGAGMRIGLYVDFAVGVAPDGAATWAAPASVVAGARIGAPPDKFNARGQDWGLAPLSPVALASQDARLFRDEVDAAMRHAGAVRIDHAMGLQRLFWIPSGAQAAGGAYVAYPLDILLRCLAEASREHRAMVIGEDLGTVPEGFRERMAAAGVLSYRVAYFERDPQGNFLPGAAYPQTALACVATHDMPTLRGWWQGDDIALRRELGMIDDAAAESMLGERRKERASLSRTLVEQGLIDDDRAANLAAAEDLPDSMVPALHVMLARSPALLLAVQLEDMLGETEQANLPGTVDEYPNWRRRMPCEIEALPGQDEARRLAAALAAERPRP